MPLILFRMIDRIVTITYSQSDSDVMEMLKKVARVLNMNPKSKYKKSNASRKNLKTNKVERKNGRHRLVSALLRERRHRLQRKLLRSVSFDWIVTYCLYFSKPSPLVTSHPST